MHSTLSNITESNVVIKEEKITPIYPWKSFNKDATNKAIQALVKEYFIEPELDQDESGFDHPDYIALMAKQVFYLCG